jgi:hypothetical protein
VPPHNATSSPRQMPSSRDAKVQLSHGGLALFPRILARGISRASTHRSSRQSPNLKTTIHPSILYPSSGSACSGGRACNKRQRMRLLRYGFSRVGPSVRRGRNPVGCFLSALPLTSSVALFSDVFWIAALCCWCHLYRQPPSSPSVLRLSLPYLALLCSVSFLRAPSFWGGCWSSVGSGSVCPVFSRPHRSPHPGHRHI